MAINIDQDICIGCGTCEALCPKVFKLNDQGKAQAIEGVIMDDETRACVKQAVDSCPVQAIEISEN